MFTFTLNEAQLKEIEDEKRAKTLKDKGASKAKPRDLPR